MKTDKTLKADDRRRVLLPDIDPGERFDYTVDSEGRIILRPLRPVPDTAESPAKVIKLKRDKSGRLSPPPGLNLDSGQIVRSIRAERAAR